MPTLPTLLTLVTLHRLTTLPILLGVMHKLHHGLTGGSRVRQIMTIHDGLGGGVTRLRYDIIYEPIHLKKTAKSSLNVRMFFKLGTLATFL